MNLACPTIDYSNTTAYSWYHANTNGYQATTNYSSCGRLKLSSNASICCSGCVKRGHLIDKLR